MALFSQSLRSLGASDSVRCARLALANITGLSGEPFTCEVVGLGKPSTAYGYNSPDCPVRHQTVR
jgi:hypothetical protein